jgi:hypothetical protein
MWPAGDQNDANDPKATSRAVLKLTYEHPASHAAATLFRCASQQKQISATEEDRTQARSREIMSNVAYDA